MEEPYEPLDLAKLVALAPKTLRERLGQTCARAYAEGYSAGWAEALSAASQRALVVEELQVAQPPLMPDDVERYVTHLADRRGVEMIFILAPTVWSAVELSVKEIARPALREQGRLAGRTDLMLALLTQRLGSVSAHHRALALCATDQQRDTLLDIAVERRAALPVYHCPHETKV